MSEQDPTAIDPDEVTEEAPPPDYEPQPDLGPLQDEGVVERDPDLIDEAEDENPDEQSEDDGAADDGDDEASDDDQATDDN